MDLAKLLKKAIQQGFKNLKELSCQYNDLYLCSVSEK